MWKTKKFIVVAALLAVALVAGTTGAVLAQDNNYGTGPNQTLLTRVAELLGIDQQKLEDVFKQAMSEQREQFKENADQRLQDMVTEGKITQEQLDAFKAWLNDKPDVDVPVFGFKFGLRNLNKLVEEGVITQSQADEIKAWLKARPELPLPDRGEFGGRRPGPGHFGSPPCMEGQPSESSTF